MTPADPNARFLSLDLVVLALVFVAAAWPRRTSERLRSEQLTALQAVELRVEQDGQTRTIRQPVPITIGRGQGVTLVIPDARVSRIHARIDAHDGELVLRDLDSRNGTLVNARPIETAVLRDGDEIDIGTARITFCGVGPWT